MPQDYFPYDRRFGDQRFQNQRYPGGRPNTFNRFEPFRPFCPPQNGCFPPQFGPNWGNQCNPCDLKALEYQNEADIRAAELQKKTEKNKLITNLALGGLGLIALFPLLGFLKKTVGTPAVETDKDNSKTITTTRKDGEPSAAELKKQREDALKQAEALKQQREQEAKEKEQQAKEYGEVK